jgi:GNAT superfamily N-acetyltransferase
MMAEPEISVELAQPEDLPAMVDILGQGQVSRSESWNEADAPAYRGAFEALSANPDVDLLVARRAGVVVGMVQLTFTRGLPDRGARKGVLESVFVATSARGQGIGRVMIAEAERRARARGVLRMSLSSNKVRVDAHRFYRTLGYAQSHEGFKKLLDKHEDA